MLQFENYDSQIEQNIQLQHVLIQEALKERIEMIDLSRVCNMNVVGGYIEEIQCPLCYNILIEPQSCKNCEKNFCKGCLTQSFRQSKKCPCCRSAISVQLSAAPKLLLALLNKLKLFCKNKSEGCQEGVDYEFRLKHEETVCQFTYVSCDNNECTREVYRKDLESHKKVCPYQLISCEKCQKFILQKDIDNHVENDCAFRQVACPWCKSTMEYCYFESHVSDCPCQYETCTFCKTKYTIEKFKNHTKVKCLKKQKNYFRHQLEKREKQNHQLQHKITEQDKQILLLQKQVKQLKIEQNGFQGKRVRLISVQSINNVNNYNQ